MAISKGADALAPYVPEKALELYKKAEIDGMYTDYAAAGRCELALLRAACARPEPFATVRGVSEGLDHRLENAVRSCTGLPQLLDALTHAVEAYLCWTNRTKEVDRDAEEATVTIFKYLERAYRDGNDMEARDNMLMAAFKAGFAFTRAGVGNVHAIAHTLGGLYNVPHGLANAVILPIVLEDYGARVYKRLARLAEITGTMTDGTDEDKAKAFIAEIYAMNARMGIPRGIEGIKEEDIPQMVDWALAEANPTYPVPVVYTREHCAQVIRRIML